MRSHFLSIWKQKELQNYRGQYFRRKGDRRIELSGVSPCLSLRDFFPLVFPFPGL